MKEFVFTFYGYFVFFYTLAMIASYIFLLYQSHLIFKRHRHTPAAPMLRRLINESPYTPGVSIVAPAYNEEATIIESVRSQLDIHYPKFELVIVNDGSKDKTLQRLIEEFELVEVPFDYEVSIITKPFKRVFKSTNDKYKKLTVVDKVNGGTKADASNAGINAAHYPYFICTDSDCIIETNAIYYCMDAVMSQPNVIAVSGNMNMSNGCDVEKGHVIVAKPSLNPLVLFQNLEYLRSFLVGKMGWSGINAIPNVSGGFGLFERKTVIECGGYRFNSMAEDQDMVTRMVSYSLASGRDYHIVQVPQICCWTEAPSTLKVLYRQRSRWGRGFIETLSLYRRMVLNHNYRAFGLVTMPFQVLFELIAPIIEITGIFVMVWLALTDGINWLSAFVIMGAIMTFGFMLSTVTAYYDFMYCRTFTRKRSYFWIILAGMLEPIFYHPLITIFSLTGYWKYLINATAAWGEMTRKGFNKNQASTSGTAAANAAGAAAAAADVAV